MIHPASDCFVRDCNSALREQIFDVTKAEGEPEIEPDRLVNDLRREWIPGIADFLHVLRLPSRRRRDNAIPTRRHPGRASRPSIENKIQVRHAAVDVRSRYRDVYRHRTFRRAKQDPAALECTGVHSAKMEFLTAPCAAFSLALSPSSPQQGGRTLRSAVSGAGGMESPNCPLYPSRVRSWSCL